MCAHVALPAWSCGPSTSPLERMRLRLFPADRRSPGRQVGADYDRLVFDRTLLMWLHVALGLGAALMYLSTLDNSRLLGMRRFGTYILLKTALSWIPYLISGAYSWRHLPARRSGIWLFILILVAGTVAVGYIYLTHYLPVLGVVLVQTAVYGAAAQLFLGRDMDD